MYNYFFFFQNFVDFWVLHFRNSNIQTKQTAITVSLPDPTNPSADQTRSVHVFAIWSSCFVFFCFLQTRKCCHFRTGITILGYIISFYWGQRKRNDSRFMFLILFGQGKPNHFRFIQANKMLVLSTQRKRNNSCFIWETFILGKGNQTILVFLLQTTSMKNARIRT